MDESLEEALEKPSAEPSVQPLVELTGELWAEPSVMLEVGLQQDEPEDPLALQVSLKRTKASLSFP